MKRYIRIVLLGIMMMFGIGNKAFATSVATSFRLPLDNYPTNDGCLAWGGTNSAYPGENHLADDACEPHGTAVYAVANGVVKFASQYKPCPNWNYLIDVEHTMPDGSKVTSIYGHTIPSAEIIPGTVVSIGQKIGEVGHFTCWSDHLHFGIYNGPYSDIPCSYDVTTGSGSCLTAGYMSTSSWPGNYKDPVKFVQSHKFPALAVHRINQKALGLFKGSYIKTASGEGIHWYNKDSSTFAIEDWDGGTIGRSAIVYDTHATNSPWAYLIRGGFWQYYSSYGDAPTRFGVALGDEMDHNKPTLGYDPYCNGTRHYTTPDACIAEYCGSSTQFTSMQRFANTTLCWEASSNSAKELCTRTLSSIDTDDASIVPDTTSYTYTSLDLTSQVSVPYTDTQSTPTGYIHPVTGDTHIAFQTDGHRIEEMTFDGMMWTSTDVTGQAFVPYAAPGTRPIAFPNPFNEMRYIAFIGDNARVQLLTWNGTAWSSLDLTSLASVDYADLHSSPSGYIHPITGEMHVTFTGQNHRIYEITYNGQAWSSLDLTGVAPVPYTAAGTSPIGFPATESTARFVTFTGSNARIQLFTYTGSNWTSADLTGLALVDYAEIASSFCV